MVKRTEVPGRQGLNSTASCLHTSLSHNFRHVRLLACGKTGPYRLLILVPRLSCYVQVLIAWTMQKY